MIRRRLVVVSLAIGCAVAAAACKKEDKGAGSGGGTAAPAKAPKVTVLVDGTQHTLIDAGRAGTWPPFGAMLPKGAQALDQWASIDVTTAAGTHEVVEAPAKKHPGLVAGVFPGEHGISFGFFAPEDLAKKGKAQWRVDDVASIAVTLVKSPMAAGGQGGGDGAGGKGDEGGERPALTADTKVVIVGPDGEKTITGDVIAKLPTTTAPVGDTDTPGWTLPQLLDAAGVKPTGKVVLYGAEGANLILEPNQLDPANAVPFIKLNRSGQLRFRVFEKAGSTWDVTGELRGIEKIELK